MINVNSNTHNLTNVMYSSLNASSQFLGVMYAFSGVHHLYSAISILFNINSTVLTMWLGNSLAFYMLVANIENIYFYLINELKTRRILSFLLIFFLVSTVIKEPYISYSYLPVCLITGSLLICYWYYSFITIFEGNNYDFINFALISFGILSFRSTYFFYGIMLIVSYIFVEILRYENLDLKKVLTISIPFIIYAFCWIWYEYGFLIFLSVFIALFLLISIFKYYPKFLTKPYILTLFLIILSIEIMSIGIIRNPTLSLKESINYFADVFLNNNYKSFKMFKSIGIMIYLIYLIRFIINFVKYKKYTYAEIIATSTITIIIYFYNPLVAPFVSTFITGSVYNRIYDLIFNDYFLIFVILNTSFLLIKILTLILLFHIDLTWVSSYLLNKNIPEINTVYKIDQEIIDISNYLTQFFKNKEYNLLCPIFIQNIKLTSNKIRFTGMPSFQQEREEWFDWSNINNNSPLFRLQMYIYRPEYYFNDWIYQNIAVEDFCEYIKINTTDLDILIVSKFEDPIQSSKIFDNTVTNIGYEILETEHYKVFFIY